MVSKLGNITFDAHDPDALARFWAAVFNYPAPDWGDFGAQLLAQGLTQDDLDARSMVEDPAAEGPRLFFNRVPESKVAKNRLHLDINSTPGRHAEPAEVDAEKDRLVALGATVVRLQNGSFGPLPEYHYVMHDPEGNEFCLQ
jgi:catechol 2,3-dioxygenase-like lactoylglutathione lyase family enzyme